MGQGCVGPYHILQYTVSGRGEITYFVHGDRQTYEQTAGKCFFITRDVSYKFGKSLDAEWECIYIGFRGELADHIFNWIFQQGYVHDFMNDSASVTSFQHLFNQALRLPLSQWDIKRIACEILLNLQKDIANSQSSNKDKFTYDAKSWVQNNIGTCNVNSMAEHYGYSCKYFQSIFKSKVDITPGAFIKQQRMLFAEQLISCTSMNLSAISKRAGFSDASHLCRQFRKSHGLTPDEFRSKKSADRI
jgi:AraC-like DNA-binding protein